jgi:hypothetical protein
VDTFIAEWMNRLLQTTDACLEEPAKAALFGACSEGCTAPWATRARELREELGPGAGARDQLEAFCRALPEGGPEVRVEGDVLRWQFAPPACPCPLTALTQNPVLCQCGTAHVQGMLEALLGRELGVTLLGSRLRGDAACSYVVRLDDGT